MALFRVSQGTPLRRPSRSVVLALVAAFGLWMGFGGYFLEKPRVAPGAEGLFAPLVPAT